MQYQNSKRFKPAELDSMVSAYNARHIGACPAHGAARWGDGGGGIKKSLLPPPEQNSLTMFKASRDLTYHWACLSFVGCFGDYPGD
jgi:hypothetical protein